MAVEALGVAQAGENAASAGESAARGPGAQRRRAKRSFAAEAPGDGLVAVEEAGGSRSRRFGASGVLSLEDTVGEH